MHHGNGCWICLLLASLSRLHKGDALMLAAGRRTYLPMSVLAGMLLIAFVAYILLYRKLSPPRTLASNSSDSHKDIMSMQVIVNGNCEAEEEEEAEVKDGEGEVEARVENENRENDREKKGEGHSKVFGEEYGSNTNEEDTLL